MHGLPCLRKMLCSRVLGSLKIPPCVAILTMILTANRFLSGFKVFPAHKEFLRSCRYKRYSRIFAVTIFLILPFYAVFLNSAKEIDKNSGIIYNGHGDFLAKVLSQNLYFYEKSTKKDQIQTSSKRESLRSGFL